MKAAVCIPFRADTPERQANFEAVTAWWEAMPFDWPVYVADSSPGVFNRSQARNRAADQAHGADAFIFGDADTIGTPASIDRAVDIACRSTAVVWPFNRFEGLSERSTERWLAGDRTGLKVVKAKQTAPGGIVVVARRAFEALGGFDEGFVGWGYEDVAFATAAETLLAHRRITGTITHLWHPYDPTRTTRDPNYQANKKRRHLYRLAEGNPAAMNRLLNDLEVVWPR